GYLETVRGKGGGMRLAKNPEDINVGTVVRHLEPDFGLVQCFDNPGACRLSGQCELTSILRRALAAFMNELDQQTLRDLLSASAPPFSLISGDTLQTQGAIEQVEP